MLDIRFIRENAKMVAKKAKQKGYEVDIPHLLELDKKRRGLLKQIEDGRAQRNALAEQLKGAESSEEQVVQGKALRKKVNNLEIELAPIEKEFEKLLKAVPNMPSDDVPVGTSEKDNVVTKEWGEKPKFDFEPKTHWEIAESRGLIDKERAAKVAGSRFAYITGDLVRLQFAIIQFVIDTLTNENTLKNIIQDFGLESVSSKPFIPILPPAMIRTEVFDAMDRLEPRDDRYKIEGEELWLQGSAEHTMGSMFADEIMFGHYLPLRYLGYLTSFRREAGTYGKETEGIIRMHQFDKLEMESFTLPKDGLNEHLFMVAIQEFLLQQLKLPYHVLNKCTAEIGKPNARGIDLEIWLPGHSRYLETHTADFMTDYQSRRLKTRVKVLPNEAEKRLIETGNTGVYNTKDALMEFVHTNDATAIALGRIMVGIIENYQEAGGKVGIPQVLRPYMGGQMTL